MLQNTLLLKHFIFCLLFSLLANIVQLISPIYLKHIFTNSAQRPETLIILMFLVLYGPLKMLSYVLKDLTSIAITDFLSSSFEIAGKKFFHNFINTHPNQYKNLSVAKISATIQQGQDAFSGVIFIFFFLLIPNIISILGTLCLVGYYLGKKYFLLQVTTILINIGFAERSYKSLQSIRNNFNKKHLHFSQTMEELIAFKEWILINNQQRKAFNRFSNTIQKRRLNETTFFQSLGWFELGQSFIIGTSISILMFLGLYDYNVNNMEFSNFLIIGTTVSRLIIPSIGLVKLVRNIVKNLSFLQNWANIEECNNIDSKQSRPKITLQLFNQRNIIQGSNLTISLNHHTILKNFNFEIPEKGLTVVSGKNGSGKSTLLRTIIGLCIPETGVIKVFGSELSLITFSEKSKLFGYVEQAPQLLSSKVCSNFGNKLNQQNNSQLMQITRLFKDKCLNLNQKYWVGINGNRLSAGEIRKIRIIQALYKQPKILILDEPTNDLDYKSASELQNLLIHLSPHISIVIATHEPNIIAAANKVIAL